MPKQWKGMREWQGLSYINAFSAYKMGIGALCFEKIKMCVISEGWDMGKMVKVVKR